MRISKDTADEITEIKEDGSGRTREIERTTISIENRREHDEVMELLYGHDFPGREDVMVRTSQSSCEIILDEIESEGKFEMGRVRFIHLIPSGPNRREALNEINGIVLNLMERFSVSPEAPTD